VSCIWYIAQVASDKTLTPHQEKNPVSCIYLYSVGKVTQRNRVFTITSNLRYIDEKTATLLYNSRFFCPVGLFVLICGRIESKLSTLNNSIQTIGAIVEFFNPYFNLRDAT